MHPHINDKIGYRTTQQQNTFGHFPMHNVYHTVYSIWYNIILICTVVLNIKNNINTHIYVLYMNSVVRIKISV